MDTSSFAVLLLERVRARHENLHRPGASRSDAWRTTGTATIHTALTNEYLCSND